MSSTTEDSDWNMSLKSRRPHSLSNPDVAPHHSTPRPNNLIETATRPDAQLAQTVVGSDDSTHSHHTFAANQSSALNNADSVPHDTPEWEAARDAVLSRMVTSQDLDAAPTPTPILKVKRGGVKTGGRRGRGGRRPKVKIEGEDSVTAEIAAAAGVKVETPTRGKNKGGRPRGSRAGISSRGGALLEMASIPPTLLQRRKTKEDGLGAARQLIAEDDLEVAELEAAQQAYSGM